jgi:predicted nucleic acid-binding protein
MTTPKVPLFVDTNALIRLHVKTAVDHPIVKETLKQEVLNGSELWISRQILREYARVLTRPQVYVHPIPAGDVARQLRQFETAYRIADETSAVSAHLYTLLETVEVGGKQIHDANIVATMQAYHISRLFTLNVADFKRFDHLITLLSLASDPPPSEIPPDAS